MSYAPRKTNEPPADPIEESTGEITSDSLAAESLQSGGDFAGGHAFISGQKSVGSTASNTDISAATTLSPAVDAEARLATEEWGENASMNAGRGLSGSGSGSGNSKSQGSGNSEGQGGERGEYKTGHGNGSAHTVGTAPTGQSRNIDPSAQRPAGSNLTEGGFDEGAPNSSYAEIGSGDDPSRLTENEFERQDAEGLVAEGSLGPRQGGYTDKGQYGGLNQDEDV